MRFTEIRKNLENIRTIGEFTFTCGHKVVKISALKNETSSVTIEVSKVSGGNIKSVGIAPEIVSELVGDGGNDFMTIEFFNANSLTSQTHSLLLMQTK
jgi:hypothetical protein